MTTLKARVPGLELSAAIDEVTRKLNLTGLSREFRSGDLLPGEDTISRQKDLLLQALDFLYF